MCGIRGEEYVSVLGEGGIRGDSDGVAISTARAASGEGSFVAHYCCDIPSCTKLRQAVSSWLKGDGVAFVIYGIYGIGLRSRVKLDKRVFWKVRRWRTTDV